MCLQYKRQSPYFTSEICLSTLFIITHRHTEQGIHLYQLKDFTDEPIEGYVYKEELQKVTKDNNALFRV